MQFSQLAALYNHFTQKEKAYGNKTQENKRKPIHIFFGRTGLIFRFADKKQAGRRNRGQSQLQKRNFRFLQPQIHGQHRHRRNTGKI